MLRRSLFLASLLLVAVSVQAASKPPVYVWLEPEWFPDVKGSFGYWQGPAAEKATGAWGIAGPGISAEWTQGGESEWNSMGATAAETKAACHRDFVVPRAGKYRVWVRYVDHRGQTEPFTVAIQQGGKRPIAGELGVAPVVPPNDEYQLYWGFSFGWASVEGDLAAGPAQVALEIDKAGQAWRQLDAVLITDDLDYTPYAREKPPFAYLAAFGLHPPEGLAVRGTGKGIQAGASFNRVKLAGKEFTYWVGISDDKKWWSEQNVDTLTPYDVLFQFCPPADIREKFHAQFAGRKDLPIMSWPKLVPGLYLQTPDLSPASPLRKWLERTKTPFYILTNYANPAYDDKTGPATYQALAGPLAGQFMGYIHGEAIGSMEVGVADKPLGKTRREHVDALGKDILAKQTAAWSRIYKTPVPQGFCATSISCLSCDSIALAHLFHEMGHKTVGYEEDATNVHVPMRIAFERGAARQYGGAWINYASGNFGDACNYFYQNPVVPRGAPSWFHSKYAVTDGVSVVWYRKLYYLNYLGGASAVYLEQGLGNQWILPGPGTHPIQLSPFGRATEDFMAFVDRLPDRGEPIAPVAVLLSYGHAYERVNNGCKMLNLFPEDAADIELRELFNVFWHPSGIVEGAPAAPDVQSMPSGVYGNIFDVLVDRPAKAKAILDYPVVWAAGDVDLSGPMQAAVEDYVKRGGTLVVNIEAGKRLPASLLGFKPTGKTATFEEWTPEGGAPQAATPFDVAEVDLVSAKPLALAGAKTPLIVRNAVGDGAVIATLVPRLVGRDERAHPSLVFLVNAVTDGLLPVEVCLANGQRLSGEVMFQLNRTKDGYVVMLMNNRGVDKTQNGVARVDRRQFADVVLRTSLAVSSAKEYTQPRDLAVTKKDGKSEIAVRVHPGDVQVVGLVAK